MKNINKEIYTLISCILSVETGSASAWHSFANSDFFNNTFDALTTAGIQEGKKALQAIGKPKPPENIAPPQESEGDKRNRFFTENSYFVINNTPYLCIFQNNMMFPASPPINITEQFYEGNIYYFNSKYYIYSEKDVFEPAIGYFKEINLEDGKVYIYKGMQCKFNKGKLQSVQSSIDFTVNEENNGAKEKNNKKFDIKKVQKRIKKLLEISKKSKIFDISELDFSNLDDEKYNIIVNTISKNKKYIKNVILYIKESDEDDEEENNLEQYEKFKKFCKKHNIKIYSLTRSEVYNFIEGIFSDEEEKEIDLKKYDMGSLKTAEILAIYAKIIEMVENNIDNAEEEEDEDEDDEEMDDDENKIQLTFLAKKVNNQCKTNLKIIMSLAKKYTKYITIKIHTKSGIKIIK